MKFQYGGRFSHNDHRGGKGAGNKKFPPSARPSIERNIERTVPLHKAENAWKPEKIRPEDLEKEEARIKVGRPIDQRASTAPWSVSVILMFQLLLKNVRALMNKITPTTKDDLIKEFLNYNVSSSQAQLASVSFCSPEWNTIYVIASGSLNVCSGDQHHFRQSR